MHSYCKQTAWRSQGGLDAAYSVTRWVTGGFHVVSFREELEQIREAVMANGSVAAQQGVQDLVRALNIPYPDEVLELNDDQATWLVCLAWRLAWAPVSRIRGLMSRCNSGETASSYVTPT